jgi:hypothetical protein
MSSTYRSLPPIVDLRNHYLPITALAFDPVSDTLWAGKGSGHVVAYYSTHGSQGVMFPVGGHMPVKHLVVGEAHVRALGQAGEGVGQWTKGGLNKWFQGCVPRRSFEPWQWPIIDSMQLCHADDCVLELHELVSEPLRRTLDT